MSRWILCLLFVMAFFTRFASAQNNGLEITPKSGSALTGGSVITITNNTDETAKVTITDQDGKLVATATIAPHGMVQYTVQPGGTATKLNVVVSTSSVATSAVFTVSHHMADGDGVGEHAGERAQLVATVAERRGS